MGSQPSAPQPIDGLLARLNEEQRVTFESLNSPSDIQAYLDRTPYSTEDADRSPMSVIRDGVAHCLDGGLFGAAALRRLGYPPLVVDLRPEPGMDDDHVLAIYRQQGLFGAVAKSNYAGLRGRQPVYRSLRELAMSYFEFYFNIDGQRTLRAYSVPMNLARLDPLNWLWDDAGAAALEKVLSGLRANPLIPPAVAARLTPVDHLTYEAGSLGVNPAGVYKPKQRTNAHD
jgi:hypothetical protein